MKTCVTCGESKSEKDFLKDRNSCKACTIAYQKAYRESEKGKATISEGKSRRKVASKRYAAAYAKTDQGKAVVKKYKQTEKGQAAQRAAMKRWYAKKKLNFKIDTDIPVPKHLLP